MDAINKLQLLAELSNECCELSHGPDTRREDFPASDYIIMPFGYSESEKVDVAVREMVVPVCYGCATALLGNEWTLLYCFECCSSQWVYRRLAKNRYRHHILWLRGCPHCSSEEEFGGLYFNDLGTIINFSGLIKGKAA
ncbi:MAG: hypothetical protein Q8L10_00840 [Candidatus Moranbacteria bacterium]|nr:hypothetical protein [Candidatus Moranbacteria bacterium]